MILKKYLLLIFLIGFTLYGQNKEDTRIEVPMKKAMFLSFFKSQDLNAYDPIERILPGNSGFHVFSDIENKDHILRLQIEDKNFKSTNLVVITTSGAFYSFNVVFNDDATELYPTMYPEKALFSKKEKKENEVVEIISNKNAYAYYEEAPSENKEKITDDKEAIPIYEKTAIEDGLYYTNRNEYYKKYSSNQIATKKNKYKRVFGINNNHDVILKLHAIEYNKDELYFFFEIKNDSPTDYIVREHTLDFLIEFKKSDIASSIDEISPKIEFVYLPPRRVKTKQSVYTVYVLKNFSIEKRKQLNVSLFEQNGERNINLILDYRMINEPK